MAIPFALTFWFVSLGLFLTALSSAIEGAGRLSSCGFFELFSSPSKVRRFEKAAEKEFGSITVLKDIVWQLESDGKKVTDSNIYKAMEKRRKSKKTKEKIDLLRSMKVGKKRSVSKEALRLLDDSTGVSLPSLLSVYDRVSAFTLLCVVLLLLPKIGVFGAVGLVILSGYWIVIYLMLMRNRLTKKQIKNRRKYLDSLRQAGLLDSFARREIAFLKANKMFNPKNVQRLMKLRKRKAGSIYL